MTYSGKELSALVKLGIAMAQADGHVDEVEQWAITSELKGFGVVGEKSSIIIKFFFISHNNFLSVQYRLEKRQDQ